MKCIEGSTYDSGMNISWLRRTLQRQGHQAGRSLRWGGLDMSENKQELGEEEREGDTEFHCVIGGPSCGEGGSRRGTGVLVFGNWGRRRDEERRRVFYTVIEHRIPPTIRRIATDRTNPLVPAFIQSQGQSCSRHFFRDMPHFADSCRVTRYLVLIRSSLA